MRGELQQPLHPFFRRRIPGHRSPCRRRSCSCSRPTIRTRRTGALHARSPASCFWSAIPSSRSTASAAPMCALYEEVKERLLARRRRTAPPHHQLPGAALDPVASSTPPSRPQWRPVPTAAKPGMFRSNDRRPEIAGQPTLIALPVPRPYGDYGNIAKCAHRRIVPRGRRRFHRLADQRERLDGRGRGPSGRRSGRGMSPFSSAASAISAPTSPEPMCVRSRRGASRTCSSAGGRSMNARRSSRCGTPSRRSSGRMTSSASSPLCAGPSSRSATKRFSLFRQQIDGRRHAQNRAVSTRCGRSIARHSIPPRIEVADALDLLRELHLGPQPPARSRETDHYAARSGAGARRASPSGRPASRRSPTVSG